MKRLFRQTLVVQFIAMLAMTVSCQQKEESKPSPDFRLDVSYVEVPAAGGKACISYTVDNPESGAYVTVNSCQADWISDMDPVSEPGKVIFAVSENVEKEPRETSVELVYSANSQKQSFHIIQAPADAADPIFVINESVVEVPADGGRYKVTYRLEDPVEGEELRPECPEVWVSDFNADTEGELSFDVGKNVSDKRQCTVKVTYAGIERSFSIVQEENVDPFMVEFLEVGRDSIEVKIVPANDGIQYALMTVDRETCDTWMPFDEDIFSAMLSQYTEYAEMLQMSLEDFLAEYVLMSGTTTRSVTGLTMETEYYLILVGMEQDGSQTTELVKYPFETSGIEMLDITFSISAEVVGQDATITVSPSIEDQNYYYDMTPRAVFDEMGISLYQMAQEIVDNTVSAYVSMGYSVKEAVYGMCSRGEETMPYYWLSPETDYMVYAFAVADDGFVVSEVSTYVFTTEQSLSSYSGDTGVHIALRSPWLEIGAKSNSIDILKLK